MRGPVLYCSDFVSAPRWCLENGTLPVRQVLVPPAQYGNVLTEYLFEQQAQEVTSLSVHRRLERRQDGRPDQTIQTRGWPGCT